MKASRDHVIVGLFAAAVALPFLGQAVHMDETLFLAAAGHALADPRHPLSFLYNWQGSPRPAALVFNNPLLFPYLLAAALKLSGGGRLLTRLLLWPLDLLAALSLYGLARRFLKRPLLPTLLALSCPAYLVNMNHLMAEKPMAALGFFGLYAVARAVEEGGAWWGWAAGGLAGAALCKYSGVLFLAPALVLARSRGARPGVLAALALAAAAPLGLCLAADAVSGAGSLQGAWLQTVVSAAGSWPAWAHRLRSFLAFTGACGAVTLIWPFWRLRRSPFALLGVLALCVLLFSPAQDAGRPVGGWDRLTGLLFALGGAASLLALAAAPGKKERGWPLWASWAGSAAFFQLVLYWSVTARLVLFVCVPLLLGLCEALEGELGERRFARWCAAGVLATAAFSLALAWVDRAYASAQRAVAQETIAPRVAQGRRVLFTGHWGLQHYLERAGAVPYSAEQGPAQAAPGDLILVSLANSNADLRSLPPNRLLDMWTADSAVPLRLINAWGGSPESVANQGSFYSSAWGFLPFAFSREPLDRFLLLETLAPASLKARGQ